MKIGFIGLGKMGYHMVEHLLMKGNDVVVFNKSPAKVNMIVKEKGAIPSESYDDLISKLETPRIIWLMVPHESVDEVINTILPKLNKGDLIIDGGNSKYTETIRRAQELNEKEIKYMDVGVSGGLAAANTGYCMMVGGDEIDFKFIEPIIKDMCLPKGYGYFGKNGAGHYVKMVHNAIEYGMMQAIGEGLDMIKSGPFSNTNQIELTELWNNGSIIRSFLIEMTTLGLKHNPGLVDVDGFVPNSGEGKWAVEDATKYGVSIPVIEQSLKVRFDSDKKKNYGTKVVAVIRDEFGGHGIAKK
ncbi:MAG: decarboxylating 6-phosphogluconate dehydrogenase [Candidatus Woesearchaeota archaeon]|jgi:6-phosphogluconate dehydrogenase